MLICFVREFHLILAEVLALTVVWFHNWLFSLLYVPVSEHGHCVPWAQSHLQVWF